MTDTSPSRREFLRLAGQGAAGIALLGVFPGCEGFSLEHDGEAPPFQFITPQHAPDWYWFSGLGYEKPYAPRIDPATWSMDIRSGGKSVGAVTYRKLKALEADGKSIAYLKTMRCIFGSFANTVPGSLTATGIFRGIPLRTVLDDTSISGEVTKLRFESTDGFQTSLSYDRVRDDSFLPVLLAYELNGQPLLPVRGGPVRLIVPEMWAYKSLKWVASVDATTDFSSWGTYETGPFAGKTNVDNPGLMALMTTVNEPQALRATVAGPTVTLRGMSLVGGSVVTAVEIKVDDGEFMRATIPQLDAVVEGLDHDALLFRETAQYGLDWPYPNIWTPWSFTIHGLNPGAHQIIIRSVDREGRSNPSLSPDTNELAQQVTLDLEVT